MTPLSQNDSSSGLFRRISKRFDKSYAPYVDSQGETVIIPLDEDDPSYCAALADVASVEPDINTQAPVESESSGIIKGKGFFENLLAVLMSVLVSIGTFSEKLMLFTGENTLHFFSLCSQRFNSLVERPLMFAFDKLKKGSRLIFIKLVKLPKTTWEDFVSFRSEANFVKSKARQMKDKRRFPVAKALWRY